MCHVVHMIRNFQLKILLKSHMKLPIECQFRTYLNGPGSLVHKRVDIFCTLSSFLEKMTKMTLVLGNFNCRFSYTIIFIFRRVFSIKNSPIFQMKVAFIAFQKIYAVLSISRIVCSKFRLVRGNILLPIPI